LFTVPGIDSGDYGDRRGHCRQNRYRFEPCEYFFIASLRFGNGNECATPDVVIRKTKSVPSLLRTQGKIPFESIIRTARI
jgi:hypothetical protein